MIAEDIFHCLREFGLTLYEAKAYFSLLSVNEATAWQIVKTSGVPQSKIYEVMKKLEKKGFVEISLTKPLIFRSVPLQEALINTVKKYAEENKKKIKDMNRKAKKLLKELESVPNHKLKPLTTIWSISGKDSVLNKARSMIISAKEECLIAGHRPLRELGCMDIISNKAKDSNIKIRILGNFSKYCTDFLISAGVPFKRSESFYEYMIVIDAKELLLVIASSKKDLTGIYTTAPELVVANKNHFEMLWAQNTSSTYS